MKRCRFFFVFLGAWTLFLTCGRAQSIKPAVLLGVGKGNERQRVELSHVYAINSAIVDLAYKSESPMISRAFVNLTARTDCCEPAVKTGPSCWCCCDNTWICTEDDRYSAIVERSTKVSEKDWLATKDNLNSIPGWSDIGPYLQVDPGLEVSRADPRVAAFLAKMGQK